MPFNIFGGGVVQPSDVSYRSVALTANVTLFWPSFSVSATDVVARIMNVTPSGPGLAITMPDAREVGNGQDVLFRNLGSDTFTILTSTAATIGTVAAGEAKYVYLTDNSTAAGSWSVVTYGTGTSSADAATLAGYGIKAISTTLNQKHDVVETSSNVVIASTDRAKSFVFTIGTLSITLPTAASVGSDFFIIVKNSGAGTITVVMSGADTIDDASSLNLAPEDGCIIYSAGSAARWYTVGLGRAVSFAFTQLVKDVAGGVNVTLSSAECANKVMSFIGIITANINVIVTNTVSVYYVANDTTGAFTLSVKTAAGLGVTVAQSTRDILVCDATDVERAVTNTATSTAFGSGSEALPSITFIGDTDTGFYLAGANNPAVTAGGTNVMIWAAVASAVNEITVTNAATGTNPFIAATGGDAAVGLIIKTRNASAPVNALTITADGSTFTGAATTATVFNTVATTANIFGAATTANFGGTPTGSLTANFFANATSGFQTKIINIGTGGAATSVTNVVMGAVGATTGSLSLHFDTVLGSSASQTLYNTVATTMNFAGAATTLTIGATSGTATIRNPTLVGSQTTQAVFNTVATTVNAFGAATTLALGAATGTATIANATVTLSNATTVNVNGASPTFASTSTGTLTFFNTNITAVAEYGAATTIRMGASSVVVGIGSASSSTTVLLLPASTTGVSTLRVPHGSAPSSPVNGDIWTTTTGIFVRINGATVGPLT